MDTVILFDNCFLVLTLIMFFFFLIKQELQIASEYIKLHSTLIRDRGSTRSASARRREGDLGKVFESRANTAS